MADTGVGMVVIGAGFAGPRTLHTMRGLGLEVVEAGSGLDEVCEGSG